MYEILFFLQIDFLSLVDVRIVKLGISHSSKAVTSNVNNGSTANEASTSTVVPFNNDKQTDAPTPGTYDCSLKWFSFGFLLFSGMS